MEPFWLFFVLFVFVLFVLFFETASCCSGGSQTRSVALNDLEILSRFSSAEIIVISYWAPSVTERSDGQSCDLTESCFCPKVDTSVFTRAY